MEVVERRAAAAVATLAEARALIATLGAEVERLARENEALRQRLDKLCQRIFARRSKKGLPVPEQGVLAFPLAAGVVTPQPPSGVKSGLWTFVSEDAAATLPISWAAERAPRRD